MYMDSLLPYCLTEVKQANLTYLLGANSAGKTTLVKKLANRLILEEKSVAIIDADIGQSSILPLTINLLYINKPFESLAELERIEWEFIPEYEMNRYVIDKLLKAERKFVGKARKEKDYCLVDSMGFVEKGAGIAFKKEEVETIDPDLIIALERAGELGPILELVKPRYHALKFEVPIEVKKLKRRERKELRNGKFKLYFEDSRLYEIETKTSSTWKYRVVGLYSKDDEFLGLGSIVDKKDDKLSILTPVRDEISKIEFSYVMVDPEKGEIAKL